MSLAQKVKHDSSPAMEFSDEMERALFSLKLEGIELDHETLKDLHLIDRNEMSHEEGLQKVLSRVKSRA